VVLREIGIVTVSKAAELLNVIIVEVLNFIDLALICGYKNIRFGIQRK